MTDQARQSRRKWLQKATLSSPPVLAISWVVVLAFGVLWLWSPVLDGFSEIYYPGRASYPILLGVATPLIGLILLGLHFICFSLAFARRWAARYLVLMLIPIAMLIGLHVFFNAAGLTRGDRRIASFQLGARAALRRAGGAAKVRQDAMTLLASSPQTPPARSDWADSFRRLHADHIRVDKEAQRVDVSIPRRPCWGEQFGYLITGQNATEPNIVDDPPMVRGHQLWKVADGIYLYHSWP